MDPVHQLKLRRMAPADLDAVVALDAALTGQTRRAYFERRLAAALRQPELHLQFAAEEGGAYRGHALARVLAGEFGGPRPGGPPPAANDSEQLARDVADVRLLAAGDLEEVVRIDRHITGRDRSAFMQHALDETLRESGVRISLPARVD